MRLSAPALLRSLPHPACLCAANGRLEQSNDRWDALFGGAPGDDLFERFTDVNAWQSLREPLANDSGAGALQTSFVARLDDWLSTRYGTTNVFRDVGKLKTGEDFDKRIHHRDVAAP